MSIQIIGNGGVIADVDGSTYRALKIVLRPVDYGLLGQYRMSIDNGGTATGPNNSTFTARWSDSGSIAIFWYIRLDGMYLISGTPDAAAFQNLSLSMLRSYTSNSTGGSAVTTYITGGNAYYNNQKLRTAMRASRMADLRIATSGSAVTLGTSTQDSQPVSQISYSTPAAAVTGVKVLGPILLYGELEICLNSAPLVLARNEGFVIQGGIASLTNVTLAYGYSMSWAEVAIF